MRLIDLTRESIFDVTIFAGRSTIEVRVEFGEDYPDTALRRQFERHARGRSIYVAMIEDRRSWSKPCERTAYYMHRFFNNTLVSFNGADPPFQFATEQEKRWFSRLGYALLCKMLARLDQDSVIVLDAIDRAVMDYYRWMGFAQHPDGVWRRRMAAQVRTLRERCTELAKDVDSYVNFVIDVASFDELDERYRRSRPFSTCPN